MKKCLQKNKSMRDEMLQKLISLDLSSSSSDSSDSKFTPSHNKNKKQSNNKHNGSITQENSVLQEIYNKWEDQDDKMNQINHESNKNKLNGKENLHHNILKISQNLNNESEKSQSTKMSQSNRFNEHKFQKVNDRLKSSTFLQKKLLDNSYQHDQEDQQQHKNLMIKDPLKTYEKLKKNIDKEININRKKNEQYLQEINNLQYELFNLKLQEVNIQRAYPVEQISNKQFTFSHIPNDSSNISKNQEQFSNLINGGFKIPSDKITSSNKSLQKIDHQLQLNQIEQLLNPQNSDILSRNTVINSPQNNLNILSTSNQSDTLQSLEQNQQMINNDKRIYHKSMEQVNVKPINGLEQGISHNNMNSNNSLNEPQNISTQKIQDSHTFNMQQNINKIIIQNSLSNTFKKAENNNPILEQNNKNLIQYNKPEVYHQNILIGNTEESDASLDFSANYNIFKPLYKNNYSTEYDMTQDNLQKSKISSSTAMKNKMKIKPLHLNTVQSSPQLTLPNEKKQRKQLKSPLQNMKIKAQEQIHQQENNLTIKKKLKAITNNQINYQSNSNLQPKRKNKSFYDNSIDNQFDIKNQTLKQQTPQNIKKMNSTKSKSQKNILQMGEQKQQLQKQAVGSNKQSPQIGKLKAIQITSMNHQKAQTKLVDSLFQNKKVKSCKECLSLISKGISASNCTSQHN